MAGWSDAYNSTLVLIMRVWDWMSQRPKKRLQARIDALELENRQHQLNGDFEQMRRTRAQLEEARRRLLIGDYE